MPCRYAAPASMTAGVWEKMEMKNGPQGIRRAVMANDHTTADPTFSRTPRRARSRRRAPMFWPTKAVTALERLCTGKKAS